MKNIFEMSVLDFETKFGNINVDAAELKQLLYKVEKLQSILNSQEIIDTDFMEKYQDYLEYFRNKYIVLGDLRVKEKSSFDFMKTIEKNLKIFSGKDYEKLNELYKTQYEEYLNCKNKRIDLQRTLEDIKKEKYNWIV